MDVTGFAALIKRKRGEACLTQETLALDVFGDAGRKADISHLENARVPNSQEATVQKICKALGISPAEMEPLRQSHPSAAQLDNIPSLSREALQNLAARFNIENRFELSDENLRKELTKRADEFRTLKSEVDAIPDSMRNLANLKAAAQDAIDRVDLEEVENLMAMVHETELEEVAKSSEIRANTALLRGKVADAYRYLFAAADSFAAVDPLEPIRRRLKSGQILYYHGLRYGSTGFRAAINMFEKAETLALKNSDKLLVASSQNSLAVALQDQGIRTQGAEGADLLTQSITAYHNPLEVATRADHPVDWAATQNNRAIALKEQGTRTQGADGADLLAQSVTAYRKALEVYTRADHPVQWAMTQMNIAICGEARAEHDSCADPRPPLTAALEAVENALTVFDPEHMSYNHAKATRVRVRDHIQAKLDSLPPA